MTTKYHAGAETVARSGPVSISKRTRIGCLGVDFVVGSSIAMAYPHLDCHVATCLEAVQSSSQRFLAHCEVLLDPSYSTGTPYQAILELYRQHVVQTRL